LFPLKVSLFLIDYRWAEPVQGQLSVPKHCDTAAAMEPRELEAKLSNLLSEHRDLDSAIDALVSSGSTDQIQVARLKKRKLRLKDEIAMVQDQLVPDIIA
jgi:hypothetical protein